MGAQVSFDYTLWTQQFPELAYILQPQATLYFNMATRLLRNDGTGPVSENETQTTLLNLLTAHIAKLLAAPAGGSSPPGLVGRITSATEGSVSVSADFPTNPSSAWFNQTTYGAFYWQLTIPYRTARYRPGPRRTFNPVFR